MDSERLRSDLCSTVGAEPAAAVMLGWVGTTRTRVRESRGSRRAGRRAAGGLPSHLLLAAVGGEVLVMEAVPRWGGFRPGALRDRWPRESVRLSWRRGTPAHPVDLEVPARGVAARLEAPAFTGQDVELGRLSAHLARRDAQ